LIRTISAVLLMCAYSPGVVAGEPIDADRIVARLGASLPERVRVESLLSRGGESEPWQRHVLTYTPDWTRNDQWRLLPEFGETLIMAGTDDGTVTTLLHGDIHQVEIGESSPTSMGVDGAIRTVPMPILNALRSARLIEKLESPLDIETYRLEVPELLGNTHVEIDVRGDHITAFRRGQSSDRISSRIEYTDYQELDSGRKLPRLILWTVEQPEPGAPPIRFETRITEVEELAPDVGMPVLTNIPDATIVDRIEGVTRRADGSVIGPIQTESNMPPATRSGGIPLQTILTWGGVALVLGAVFIYVRRARAMRA
jgi:hypothetical protein